MNPSDHDVEADELVEHWGFVVPDRRRTPNSKEQL